MRFNHLIFFLLLSGSMYAQGDQGVFSELCVASRCPDGIFAIFHLVHIEPEFVEELYFLSVFDNGADGSFAAFLFADVHIFESHEVGEVFLGARYSEGDGALGRTVIAVGDKEVVGLGGGEVAIDLGCCVIVDEVGPESAVEYIVGDVVDTGHAEHDGVVARAHPCAGVEAIKHLGIFELDVDVGHVFLALAEIVEGVGLVDGRSYAAILDEDFFQACVLAMLISTVSASPCR